MGKRGLKLLVVSIVIVFLGVFITLTILNTNSDPSLTGLVINDEEDESEDIDDGEINDDIVNQDEEDEELEVPVDEEEEISQVPAGGGGGGGGGGGSESGDGDGGGEEEVFEIIITSPIDFENFTSNETLPMNFTIEDSENVLDSCWYNINQGENISLANCSGINFNVEGEGFYLLEIYVNSTDNQEIIDFVTFNVSFVPPSICGNDILESGEECDGLDLGENTCSTVDPIYLGGELNCYPPEHAQECMFDVSECSLIEEYLVVPEDYFTIQEAIDASNDDDLILVWPGIYNENINFLGKKISVIGKDGATNTIIDCFGLNTSCVVFDSGENSETLLQGFTIKGGTGSSFGPDKLGGGIYIQGSNPSILESIVLENTADAGGGIMIFGGSPFIFNSTIKSNTVSFGNILTGGGGIFINGGNPTIGNSIIKDNYDGIQGGGIRSTGGNPLIFNTLIYNNSANQGGGAFIQLSNPIFLNVAFIGNEADDSIGNTGGGIRTSATVNSTKTIIINSIMWDNYPEDIADVALGNTVVNSSIVESGWSIGSDIFTFDPLFVDTDNFRLLSSSPAIDIGLNDEFLDVSLGIDYDLDQNPRFVENVIDLGPYENQGSSGLTGGIVSIEGKIRNNWLIGFLWILIIFGTLIVGLFIRSKYRSIKTFY